MTHYYSPKQTSDLNLEKIRIRILGEQIEVYTGSGVFSRKRLDKGTELLLKGMQITDGEDILDFGCGIGIVGLWVKMNYPSTNITLTDVNERAVKLALMNLKLYKLEGKVKATDGLKKVKQNFDTILLNPPQVAGKKTCFRLIEESCEHLKPKGSLQIVARHNKGGKSYSEHMKKTFGNVTDLKKGSGYRVYMSKKS